MRYKYNVVCTGSSALVIKVSVRRVTKKKNNNNNNNNKTCPHTRNCSFECLRSSPPPTLTVKTVQKIEHIQNRDETYFPVADVTAVAGRRADGTAAEGYNEQLFSVLYYNIINYMYNTSTIN